MPTCEYDWRPQWSLLKPLENLKAASAWHPNIRSVDDLSAEAIATLLSELCRLFDADPGAGGATQPIRPDFISDAPPFPFADRLAADLRESAARAFT